MADIPPVAASGLQAGYQQAEVAKQKDAQGAGQSDSARRGAKAIDDADKTIETTDEDVAVFADAEGAGGQGRHHEEEPDTDDHEHRGETTDEGPTDEDDQPHIDLQA